MQENIRLSIRGILSHKLRSLLTMLGIIIGIAAIIAIVSTIKGTNEQIQTNLIGSGVNTVNVRMSQGDWEYDYSQGKPSRYKQITNSQLDDLGQIDGVESVALYHRRQVFDGVYHLTNALSGGYVYGVDASFLNSNGLIINTGRGFSDHDIQQNRKICLLDKQAVEQLFQGEDPIGNTVEIQGEPFIVVGTVGPEIEFEPTIKTMEDYYTYSQDSVGKVYVPTSIWPLLYQYDEPENVMLRAKDTGSMTSIGKAAENILNVHASENSEISYKAEDLMKQARQIQQLSQATNTMLLWIAGISLLVGGIGVMNIMLVSVTERTREIGLKKALGAPKKSILIQFLTEAVVLTSTGGIVGVIFGVVLAFLISRLNGTPVAISLEASIFAVLFSMLIGIVFGILPSYKAANLNPIDALRRE
ncbi:MAG: ABC transporter permease [Erysipelotrichaceae bacterium]|nr:ABC transporter permease [Erysipelotrichaceae bacterium]MDY6035599.1 ABC transporter permease [Bulleidia sp.]